MLTKCVDRVQADHDFSRTLDPEMLEHARRLAAAQDDKQPDIQILSLLGAFHLYRFLALGEKSPDEMEIVVKAFARCLIYGDEPLPQRIVSHVLDEAVGLAIGLLRRVAESDDPFLTDQAVDAWRRIKAVTPADHPDRAMTLNNLRVALMLRFGDTVEMADLEEAVALGRQAVQAVSADDPGRAMPLANLGHTLLQRAIRTESSEDLDRCVALWREAVHLIPADHPNRVQRCSGPYREQVSARRISASTGTATIHDRVDVVEAGEDRCRAAGVRTGEP
ncbi:hypothetical protein AB0J28_04200 [Streptosporangium canum]|uniref:hypothetical protein n=1 Tax=Streptosporangium canum TaxID=324952 RepID=UPI0034431565